MGYGPTGLDAVLGEGRRRGLFVFVIIIIIFFF
jgi:hypothetical protein